MPRPAVSLVRLMPAPDPGPPDVQLLRAFTAARGEEAFAEIVRRHGPMVLAACRRVLGNRDDADDAFQAVFLVLARKANAIRGSNLAGWLYAVAVRTARGVRIMRDRRRKHSLGSQESGVRSQKEHPCSEASLSPDSGLLTAEVAAVIDEELARLPECYREVVVLCELRGLSRKQAAAEIGILEGTLSSRLAAAKRKLAARLSARGLSAPAALAAALAPASVSAALVRSAVAATYGVGAPVASAAASAIVKAMLFDQLRAVTLAAGILLTVVCGGWAMTGTPGGDTPPTAPAPSAADPAAKLVAQLGAAEFADREAAHAALRKMGLKAEPALNAGLRSEDPEVRDRAAKLLAVIRGEALNALVKGFDPNGTDDPAHPVWRRFKTIAGSDAAARKLFAEIIADPRRLRLLVDADRDPDKAGDLYAAEVDRVHVRVQELLDRPDTSIPRPEELPWPEAVSVVYLGTYPTSTGKVKDGWKREGHVFIPSGHEMMKSPAGAAVKRVFAAWLARRDDPLTLERGFGIAAYHGIKEVLPFAREVAADKTRPVKVRVSALPAVAQFGTPGDIPLFAAFLGDTSELASNFAAGVVTPLAKGGIVTTEVRDCAAGLALLLCDRDPFEFGFGYAATRFRRENGRPVVARFEPFHFGFDTAEGRTTAHAKTKAFLDKQKEAPKNEEPKPDPAVLKLVEQLGAPEFADREAAQKALRELGAKAEGTLKAALKSESPEVRDRAAKLLTTIRKDALEALAKGFDPAKERQPDHPVWKRFKVIAGEGRAGRELFAMIIANDKWLRTLDKAEAIPGEAGHIYRVGVAEMFRDFYNDPAKSPPWPCDRPEEVAYLLFLGSYADSPTTKLEGDEIVPDDPKRLAYLGRGIIRGEEQIIHANGVSLGLEGKWLKWQTRPAVAGTDRVFAKLLAAWLERRDPASSVVPRGLRIAGRELVPFARRIAANDFEPKREVPPNATIAALVVVAQLGTRADLPHFERHFGDETNVAAVDKPRADGVLDYHRPAPLTETTQLRDVALGLALLLHGANPEDFGFVVRKDTFKQKDGRYTIPWSTQLHLGFNSEASRTAAFKKAKAWLAE